MMTHEKFIKIEKEWITNEIPTMFYIGELQQYKNSLEAKITELKHSISKFNAKAPTLCENCHYYKHKIGFCTNADANIPEKYFKKCPNNFYCDEHLLIND
jgi:hypothetical protein